MGHGTPGAFNALAQPSWSAKAGTSTPLSKPCRAADFVRQLNFYFFKSNFFKTQKYARTRSLFIIVMTVSFQEHDVISSPAALPATFSRCWVKQNMNRSTVLDLSWKLARIDRYERVASKLSVSMLRLCSYARIAAVTHFSLRKYRVARK